MQTPWCRGLAVSRATTTQAAPRGGRAQPTGLEHLWAEPGETHQKAAWVNGQGSRPVWTPQGSVLTKQRSSGQPNRPPIHTALGFHQCPCYAAYDTQRAARIRGLSYPRRTQPPAHPRSCMLVAIDRRRNPLSPMVRSGIGAINHYHLTSVNIHS